MERKDLEKKLEKLSGRISAKRVDLDATRSEIHKKAAELAAEDMGAKWDKLAEQHGLLSVRESALSDDIAELGRQIKSTRLGISDLDLSDIVGELTQLSTEGTEIRLKMAALQEEFRRAVSQRQSGEVYQLKIIEMKSEIAQLSVAGDLTRRHMEASKKRRAELEDARALIDAE
jgi:predicted  nucleic acid-binding Zn-ribbon protein